MSLEHLFLSGGKYVDNKGNITDKENLILIGGRHTLKLGLNLNEEMGESYKEYLRGKVSAFFSQLIDINPKYREATSYLIKTNQAVLDENNSVYSYPIFFLKKEEVEEKPAPVEPIPEYIFPINKIETSAENPPKKKRERVKYNTEDPLELYHKWSKEEGHNLTMVEVREKDEKYSIFLYNRKYQNGLDLSIIPKGKRDRLKTKNIEKVVERVKRPVILPEQKVEENSVNYSADNNASIDKDSTKWINWSFEDKIRYSIESQLDEDKKSVASFTVENEVEAKKIINKLGYKIVGRDDKVPLGMNFKIQRAG